MTIFIWIVTIIISICVIAGACDHEWKLIFTNENSDKAFINWGGRISKIYECQKCNALREVQSR